MSLMTLFN